MAASGVEGAERITLTLDQDPKPPRSYTVRMHFMEPEDISPGERVFSLRLDGNVLLEDFDIIKEAGAKMQAITREFKGIMLAGKMTLELVPKTGEPLICGLELVAETAR